MSKENNSRYYYMSNENMSGIEESIHQSSKNFGRESGRHGNSGSQIAEMISQSHNISQSKAMKKTNQNKNIQAPIPQQNNNEHEFRQEIGSNAPVNLGNHIFKIIKERYYETTKVFTDDPQVLYNYYLSQRKVVNTIKPIKDQDIEKQMPTMQRKLMVKKQFHKILTYYPNDVYYSLHCEVERMKKDRQLQQKVQYFNRGNQNNGKKKVSQKQMDKIVDKLYNTKGNFKVRQENLTPQQEEKNKRTKFGRNLSEYFQNHYRQKGSPSNIETVEKLHTLWEDTYEREQYQIDWEEETAKIAIEQYMYEQIEDLMAYANRKLGFKCGKAMSLLKVYQQNLDKIQHIYIPMNSFEEYVKVFNEVERRKVEHEMERAKQNSMKSMEKRKKSEVKKFGRPVSATPISILAQPKTQNTLISQVATKYPQDKLIKTLLTEDQIKKPRFSFEYGVYDIKQEVKMKQWVKINQRNPLEKYDEKIHNKLVNTFTNPEFFNADERDQVMSILDQDEIEKDQTWKELGPTLQQAMLVKAHQQPWFRDCIIRYAERVTGQNNKMETNQILFKKLFNYLNGLSQNEKVNQFGKLQSIIQTSEDIAQRTKKIESLAKDPSKTSESKSRRLLLFKLEGKAIDFVRMRIQKKNDKFTLRQYLKDLFEQCMKEHKDYIKKNYNVVQGDKQCPKLLKYEFFRIVKQINPITLAREAVVKNHAWIPTKQTPNDFNYKTFNTYAEFYKKDKNYIDAKPQEEKKKQSIWGRAKGKDRQNLMMTYNDAKQCTFQPKISKDKI